MLQQSFTSLWSSSVPERADAVESDFRREGHFPERKSASFAPTVFYAESHRKLGLFAPVVFYRYAENHRQLVYLLRWCSTDMLRTIWFAYLISWFFTMLRSFS
jgi:hypothetical protein